MKLKFKETCKDKFTNETYEKGKTYEFTDERGQEILTSDYVEEIKEELIKEPKKKSKKTK